MSFYLWMSGSLWNLSIEECQALPSRLGATGLLIWAGAIAALAAFVPRLIGAHFFDPPLMNAYAALSFLFATPAVIEAVCEDAGRRLPANFLWAKVLISAGFGWVSFLLLLAGRIVAVKLQYQPPEWLTPGAGAMARLCVVAAGMALAGAGLGAWVGLHSGSARLAKQVTRTGFLLVFLLSVLTGRQSGGVWRWLFSYAGGAMAGAVGLALAWVSTRHTRYSGAFKE